MRKSGGNPNDGENTPPHPPVSWDHVRKDAHVKGNTEPQHESKHDSALSHLDRSEGSESGGR